MEAGIDLGFIWYFDIFRNEKTQVDALREFYAENDGGENKLLKVCIFIGQWGIPFMFISFATIYWTMGMSKYYSG